MSIMDNFGNVGTLCLLDVTQEMKYSIIIVIERA